MFTFFSAIASFVNTAVTFVVNTVLLFFEVIVSMIRAVTWLFACLAYLPPFLTAFFIVPVSLAIIFQVMNKGG